MSAGGDPEPGRLRIFDNIPTADLEAELARRKDAERQAAEVRRKAREVWVVCPVCESNGSYRQTSCRLCNSTGKVKAVLAEDQT